jgi:flagellar hook protein FlgE
MAIGGGLSAGRSGLINSSAALGVIGNNIANVSTVGFKSSRTEFADLISAEAGGEIGKIGLGSRVGAVRTLFAQGPVESTGRSLDVALDGIGFFVLRDGEGKLFTRAGNMQLTATGTMTNTAGLPVQGYPVTPEGVINGGAGDINVAGAASQAQPTTAATFKGNLKADVPVVSAPGAAGTMSFQQHFDAASYSTSVDVYDSLGQKHEMSMFYYHTGPNTWEAVVGVPEAEYDGGISSTSDFTEIRRTTLTFGGDGAVISGSPVSATADFVGADPQSIAIDLNDMTQFASPSGVSFVLQNGFGSGGLTNLGIDESGIVSGTFDNGQSRPLFQLAVAHFAAPEGLSPAGNQLYRETVRSGPPAVATAQSQGNGSVVGSALEQSNVQIAQEFIELITQQRAFQANARVITASDQLLTDLINIIR